MYQEVNKGAAAMMRRPFFLSPLLLLQFDSGQRFCKCCIHMFFFLVFQVFLHVFFGDTGSLFFPPRFESGELLFISALTYKGLVVPLFDEFHFFVAVGAAGVA